MNTVPLPSPTDTDPVTELANAWMAGNLSAGNRLFQHLYQELHRRARGFLRGERRNHTLQTTALIHEAYLRLDPGGHRRVVDRRHFLRVATQAMRRVLIDHARRRKVQKRGAGQQPITLDEEQFQGYHPNQWLALHEALGALEEVDSFKAQLVELRFFGGFSIPETAQILGCSHATVERHWRVAQGWLYRELA